MDKLINQKREAWPRIGDFHGENDSISLQPKKLKTSSTKSAVARKNLIAKYFSGDEPTPDMINRKKVVVKLEKRSLDSVELKQSLLHKNNIGEDNHRTAIPKPSKQSHGLTVLPIKHQIGTKVQGPFSEKSISIDKLYTNKNRVDNQDEDKLPFQLSIRLQKLNTKIVSNKIKYGVDTKGPSNKKSIHAEKWLANTSDQDLATTELSNQPPIRPKKSISAKIPLGKYESNAEVQDLFDQKSVQVEKLLLKAHQAGEQRVDLVTPAPLNQASIQPKKPKTIKILSNAEVQGASDRKSAHVKKLPVHTKRAIYISTPVPSKQLSIRLKKSKTAVIPSNKNDFDVDVQSPPTEKSVQVKNPQPNENQVEKQEQDPAIVEPSKPTIQFDILRSPQLPLNTKEIRAEKNKAHKMFLDHSVNYTDPEKYGIAKTIGKGTYGEVFKGYEVKTRKAVAIKRMVFNENAMQGISYYEVIAREIKCLQRLQNGKFIVKLLDTTRCNSPETDGLMQYELIFEYCPYDLGRLIRCKNVEFKLEDIKTILRDLFTGLDYIHGLKVLHRDIKPENILLTPDGIVKIADMGLARETLYSPMLASITWPFAQPEYTNNVVTLWYRPPEILLGAQSYTAAVDVWSAACVMAEFWLRKPLMAGDTEQKQLHLISDLCGSIIPEDWPAVSRLKLYGAIKLPTDRKRRVRGYLSQFVDHEMACDLLDKLLKLDPLKRLQDETVLNHDFFWFDPLPNKLKAFMERLKTVKFDSWYQ